MLCHTQLEKRVVCGMKGKMPFLAHLPPYMKRRAPITAHPCLYRAGAPLCGSALHAPMERPLGASCKGPCGAVAAGLLGVVSLTSAATDDIELPGGAAEGWLSDELASTPPVSTVGVSGFSDGSCAGTSPRSGHLHHSGANSSTALTYMNMHSILLRLSSSFHAFQRALATVSHMDGRGSLHGPNCACFARASRSNLSETSKPGSSCKGPSP